MNNLATFQIGNYVIFKKRIGKGAFSTIYKAYHKHSKETVAVKEISLDTLNKYESSLRRETEIMKNLNHPHIVKLFETIIDEKTENVYLVMEYFERGDFSSFLRKRPLREKYAVKYLKQIAEGIKYLLEHKILHRDLKPQNILVSQTGTLKITDFGFARYFDNDMLIQTICGSPMYMAPEIMKNKKYDYKSDLWSIGVIFYEMLIGRPPFKAKNIYELIRVIENENIEIPSKFILSKDCKHLLLSLLEKNPKKRIEWEDFFQHPLIRNCDPFEEENKLMEISGLGNFPSIPQKSNIFDSQLSLYCDTKKKNMLRLEREEKNLQQNIITFNENSLFHSENSEIGFNFHLQDDSLDSELDEDSQDNFYESYENPKEIEKSYLNSEYDFIRLEIEEDYFKSSMSLRNDFIKNNLPGSYVYIDVPKKNIKNKFEMSKSVIHYLSSSVKFFKESYKYFSHYNSI